jgi:hypothetical protein
MASWGKTDTLADAPKYLTDTEVATTVFIDTNEAVVSANRSKGLKTPGWNTYSEYVDQNGNTRKKVEPLVVMKVTAAEDTGLDVGVTGDTAVEDAIVADS